MKLTPSMRQQLEGMLASYKESVEDIESQITSLEDNIDQKKKILTQVQKDVVCLTGLLNESKKLDKRN